MREITQNELILRIIRFFNLGAILKKIYYLFYAVKNKKMELNFKGMRSFFYVNNYESIIIIENALKNGVRNESDFLDILFRFLKSGDVVYDIGANIGIHTIFLAKRVGKKGVVVAFEPEEKNSFILRRNIEINELKNVRVFTEALGDKNEQMYLYKNKKGGIGKYSLVKGTDRWSYKTVQVNKGDCLVSKKNLPLPNAVKIDVEGFEFPVLKGLEQTLLNKNCRIICCEIHNHLYPKNITPQDVLNYINKLGFTKIETKKRGNEIHAICYK